MKKLLWRSSVSVLLIGAVVVGLLAFNLHSFNRLTSEALIAKLRFSQIAAQEYQVELRTGDFCQPIYYQIYGDEWRVDARFLKWKPWANLIGMDAMYRLTGEEVFKEYADRWGSQLGSRFNRVRSQVWKAYFKLTRF